ncbi:hypothetical protein LH398_03930 [Fusobacterium nucleatum]
MKFNDGIDDIYGLILMMMKMLFIVYLMKMLQNIFQICRRF